MVIESNGPHPVTVLLGNPRPGSRTANVARRAADTLVECLAARGVRLAEPSVVDLSGLTPLLATADWAQPPPAALAEAYRQVTSARLLLVATPTFKGSYTGLLKLFVDPLPRRALGATVAVPVMTAARAADQHAVDSHLRPLLLALDASVPVPGLSVLESQFDRLDDVVGRWCSAAAPVLAGVLPAVADPILPMLPDPSLLTFV